jgi:hypothetical protein
LRRQAGVIHEDYGEESFADGRNPWEERLGDDDSKQLERAAYEEQIEEVEENDLLGLAKPTRAWLLYHPLVRLSILDWFTGGVFW